jgi:phosphoribosylformimino-5-aminoimidazole carboxamide ribotide isomerase
MRVFPSLDLRQGSCVQLVGGSLEAERLRLPHPVEVARRWVALGFRSLHVVDLDAATGQGSNAAVVEDVLTQLPGVDVQVGGGLRDEAGVRHWLEAGAKRVVLGTRAVGDRGWLEQMALLFPGRLVVAADARGRQVVTHGWSRTLEQDVAALVASLDALPLAAVLVTTVHREGQMQGTDLALLEELVGATHHPLQASGGIASAEELRRLGKAGVSAAVLGMALYTGAVDGAALAREFA